MDTLDEHGKKTNEGSDTGNNDYVFDLNAQLVINFISVIMIFVVLRNTRRAALLTTLRRLLTDAGVLFRVAKLR